MSAIALFGKMLSFSRLKVMTDDLAVIKAELENLVGGKTPIPVVIDSDVELDLADLMDMLWELGIQPIGVVQGKLTEQANKLRLATFPADGKRIERLKPVDTTRADKKPTPPPTTDHEPIAESDANVVIDFSANDATSETIDTQATQTDTVETADNANDVSADAPTKSTSDNESNSESSSEIVIDLASNHELSADVIDHNITTGDVVQAVPTSTQTGSFSQEAFDEKGLTSSIHNQMLRSGQSLQHLGGDLIIIGGVNNGAEAITDNNLHIYGHGQGRLVAGATGDKDARIFCQKFNPSLVSVAGTYCLREAIPAEMIDKAVQVSYDADKGLIFTLMSN